MRQWLPVYGALLGVFGLGATYFSSSALDGAFAHFGLVPLVLECRPY